MEPSLEALPGGIGVLAPGTLGEKGACTRPWLRIVASSVLAIYALERPGSGLEWRGVQRAQD